MVLQRYLAKEIITTLLAVTAVLLIIFLSNQVIHYLNDAAAGKIAPMVLTHLIALQIPYLLNLLLPIGLFFGVLFVLSRMSADSELIILFASGLSPSTLLRFVLTVALIVALFIALLSLWISPVIAGAKDRVANVAVAEAAVSQLLPGRFQSTPDQSRVFYVQSMSTDHVHVQNVFIAERAKPIDDATDVANNDWVVVSADSAVQKTMDGANFLVTKTGNRYQGTPGAQNYLAIQFDDYGVQLNPSPPPLDQSDMQAKPTMDLWSGRANLDAMAELQWRLSIPLVAFLLALLAVPLSRTQVRQGQYAQLLPAILICILYVNLLFVARAWVEKGKISPWLGVWWVHGLILLIGLGLLGWQRWRRL